MPPQDLERKLTAILSADVAGYSLLMTDDEEATVRTLTDYRKAMASLIQRYRGRVVDSPGDNLLADFPSVVDAVNCAVEIQRELAERNAELTENRKMEFRIGLNLGDVVTEGERIYGDGVNIAARMEGIAEGGGVCLSGGAYDAIENKTGLQFEYLGEHEVKNITKPIRAYRVLMVPEAAANASGEKKPISRVSHKGAIPVEKKDLALPDGPSIAVLPFVNMSGDPEQEYFTDGLTENIIAGLSVERRLLVIARNSTFVYKGKSVDIQEVGRKLGAQYVVEGSVQKTQDRVRITAQLIDANTGHHVWAHRYDRDLEDIFALQDEITMKIAMGVGMKIVEGEQYRYGEEFLPPSGNAELVMKLVKVYEYFHHRPNKEGNVLARKELEDAIALEPEWSKLYATLAWTHIGDLLYQSSKSPEISFAKASKNIEKALALDSEDWYAHYSLSFLNLFRKEHDKAVSAAQSAIALNPNAADAYWVLGFALIMSGRTEEGIRLIEKAMRLHPMPPDHYLMDVGFGYYFLGRYEDAIEIHKELLKRTPDRFGVLLYLTATYSASGREEEARHQAEELLRLDPSFSLEQVAEVWPIKDEAELERFIADLRKAGLK